MSRYEYLYKIWLNLFIIIGPPDDCHLYDYFETLLKNPNKKTASNVLYKLIRYWFEIGPYMNFYHPKFDEVCVLFPNIDLIYLREEFGEKYGWCYN